MTGYLTRFGYNKSVKLNPKPDNRVA